MGVHRDTRSGQAGSMQVENDPPQDEISCVWAQLDSTLAPGPLQGPMASWPHT